MKQEETFLRDNFVRYPLRSINCDKLIADSFLTEANDEQRVKKLKNLFALMVKNENDETALEILKLMEKAFMLKEKNIAETPNIGNATYRAIRQLNDWLMNEVWWELTPGMIETRFWILEKIIIDWKPKRADLTQNELTSSTKAFRFLITAYNPLRSDYYDSDTIKDGFTAKSKGREVFPREKKKILALFQERNTSFKSEELEEWIMYPSIPYDIERILAIARTRNGGRGAWSRKNCIWQDDIRNAKLVKLNAKLVKLLHPD